MSGAGKHLAARFFEDMGRRVIDNLPPRLLPLVLGETDRAGSPIPLCIVCDVRGGQIADLLPAYDLLLDTAVPPRLPTPPILLFLDATDESLIQRFKETRRTHPLFLSSQGIQPAIAAERDLLSPIRGRADRVIDTTHLAPAELRLLLVDAFAPPIGQEASSDAYRHPLTVTVASFGFKHGTPTDADLLFDVRFLRNPHYVDELRPYDGRDAAVEAYVMGDERTSCFLDRLYDLVGWSLPQYVAEGKAYLTIGVGCTGGKHRSVVVAEKLTRFLSDRGYRVLVQHRDVNRDRQHYPPRPAAAPEAKV